MAALQPLVKPKISRKRSKKCTWHQSDGCVRMKPAWQEPRSISTWVWGGLKGKVLMLRIGYGNKMTKLMLPIISFRSLVLSSSWKCSRCATDSLLS
ncbi:mCG60998 [Mus musculus]|nr:mCG60998 [Mus musculus]